MDVSLETLRERIQSAKSLQSIVETMRTLALVNIRRAEHAAQSSATYLGSLHIALHVALGSYRAARPPVRGDGEAPTLLVLASNQGLCGQFNERVLHHARQVCREAGRSLRGAPVICVGYRGAERLDAAGADVRATFDAPNSVEAVGTVVRQVYLDLNRRREQGESRSLQVVHNYPLGGANYADRHFQLLPFDAARWRTLPGGEAPFVTLPQTSAPPDALLHDLVRELLYIDLYRALMESFAAENAARLASMQGAADNIEERLAELEAEYREVRQDAITSELMDIVTGAGALTGRGERTAQ